MTNQSTDFADKDEVAPTAEATKTTDMNNTTNIKSFHYLEDGSIDFSILATNYTAKKLNKGVYDLGIKYINGHSVVDLKVNINTENYNTDITHYFVDKISRIYNSFFNPDVITKVHTLGYKHKLGILLYGKQGTGKTTMFKKYFTDVVENHNGIVFIFDEYDHITQTWEFIQKIRKIQNNPIICFMDEIDDPFVTQKSFEREIKIITDGMKSIDNCLFFMATNYIEKIPKTIKDRPSRIKYCIQVDGIQSETIIRNFLETNLKSVGIDYTFSKSEISDLKGSTLDELKQWLLDKIMNLPNEPIQHKKLGF